MPVRRVHRLARQNNRQLLQHWTQPGHEYFSEVTHFEVVDAARNLEDTQIGPLERQGRDVSLKIAEKRKARAIRRHAVLQPVNRPLGVEPVVGTRFVTFCFDNGFQSSRMRQSAQKDMTKK